MRRARIALALLALCAPAAAQEADESTGTGSRSVGAPDRGRLENGVVLPDSDAYVRLSSDGTQWGTEELVGLLQRAAVRLQRMEEGPRLLVGSLSLRGGGRMRPHDSHQSGRDADVSIFVTDLDGASVEPSRFVDLAPTTGCGRDEGGTFCLDPRRTFLFIVALLEDEVAQVRFVLIAADLRQLVLAAGRRADVSEEMLRRVEEVTSLRDGSASHRSHLHVRIECPEDDRGCAN